MRFLRGLRIRAHGREIEEFAMKLGCVLGPERLHHVERFPCLRPPAREIAAKYLDFLFQPPRADAKDEAASAMVIQGGDLLGQEQWITLRHQSDSGCQLQRRRHPRRTCQGDVGVREMRIGPGDGAARGWERARTLDRHGGMLRIPDRIEAQTFRRSPHEGWVDGVGGQWHGQSDTHDDGFHMLFLPRSVVPSHPRGNHHEMRPPRPGNSGIAGGPRPPTLLPPRG